MRARRALMVLGMAGLTGGIAAVASPAWACSPAPKISTTVPRVQPGGEVPVKGEGWLAPGNGIGPVELRWHSNVGAPVASTAGMSFSVRVPVPTDVVDGYYVVNAQQWGPGEKGDAFLWQRSTVIKVDVPVEEVAAEPTVTGPVVTGPVVTGPVVLDPETSDGVAEPVETEQALTDPVPPHGPVPQSPLPQQPVAQNPLAGGPGSSGPGGPGPGPSSFGSGGSSSDRSGSISAGSGGGPRSPGGFPAAGAGLSFSSGDAVVVPRHRFDGRAAAVGSPGGPLPDPASFWSEPGPSEPAPSLFEPVETPESVGGGGSPVGAGLGGLGLISVLGIAVVAGQRRLTLAGAAPGSR